jgi:hypothetical protein
MKLKLEKVFKPHNTTYLDKRSIIEAGSPRANE